MMAKKIQQLTSLATIGWLCLYSTASQAAPSFEQKFHELSKQLLPNAAIGLVIQDPSTHQFVFEIRGEDNFYPASNTKLFAASAALKFFGENFQYQTSLHTFLNKMEQGILKDDVYLVFRGDPSLTIQDLSAIFRQLKILGVNQIEGNLVIDDKAFEGPAYAPGWTWESIPYGYSAPVTSIILNENKVRLKFNKPEELNVKESHQPRSEVEVLEKPALSTNSQIEINKPEVLDKPLLTPDVSLPIKIEQADSQLPSFPIHANVIGVSTAEAEKSCQFEAKVKGNVITLNGCWPLEKTPKFIDLAIDSPRRLAKAQILQLLQQLDIKLTGTIVFEKAPNHIPALIIKKSPPLKNLLFKALAESNNIYTESLTKALGVAYLGQGTFQAGLIAIQDILKKEGQIEFSQARLSDGSGQSRYNLVSPVLICQLLNYMYHDPLFPVFYAALSTSGKTGSLAERLNSKELEGQVVAKTGSAIGSSALSGYFRAKNGKEYIFSLMINQSTKNPLAIKGFEDKICQAMIDEPWETPSAALPTKQGEILPTKQSALPAKHAKR